MGVACSDLKAEQRIERRDSVEVAHCMDNMIEAAGHPVTCWLLK
jgi:hypothetical protein